MLHRSTFPLAAAAWLLAGSAAGQVQTISTESFDYSYPGLLINTNGGAGWAAPWDVGPSGNEVVIFQNNGQHPPFGGDDGIGNFAGQGQEYGTAFREVDPTGQSDVLDGGKFGADGAVLWFTVNTRTFQQFGDHYGGLSLYDGTTEHFFIGTPWGTYEWGLDDVNGSGPVTIPGTDDELDATLVVRIDYLPGLERAQLWLNPSTANPLKGPDLEMMILDHRFDRIGLSSGGAASLQYWDGIRIEKGEPTGNPIGDSYCGPANLNSSGKSGVIAAVGSDIVFENDVLLRASELPANQFGYFLNSMTFGFVVGPGGSQGNLCLGGAIGRYNNDVASTGAVGKLSLQLDLTETPTPGGSVAILAGETWRFQCWFRDQNPIQTSNFTDGVVITFQ